MSTKTNARKATFVVAADGTRLMPTFNVKKVRKLLRSGKATILSYRPYFTIKLTYTPEENVMLYSINEADNTAAIAWSFAVPVKDIRCLKHVSGWEEYFINKKEI